MALLAMAVPVLPGKEEQWRRFTDEINTTRKAEFDANRRRLGVHERTFGQATPDGHQLAIVTLEGDDPAGAFARLAQMDDEFTNWFLSRVEELHGINFRQPPPGPLPELIAESGSPEEAN